MKLNTLIRYYQRRIMTLEQNIEEKKLTLELLKKRLANVLQPKAQQPAQPAQQKPMEVKK